MKSVTSVPNKKTHFHPFIHVDFGCSTPNIPRQKQSRMNNLQVTGWWPCRGPVADIMVNGEHGKGVITMDSSFWCQYRILHSHRKAAIHHIATIHTHIIYIIEGSLNRNFRQYGELKSSSRVIKSVDRRCNSQKVRRKDDTHAPNVREVTKCCVFS